MPRGPKGQKRPADVISMSVKVMRIATGEETDELEVETAEGALKVREDEPAPRVGAGLHRTP
jgi:hypothetical protein